ncbi:YwmB family TATA-box binding protein [Bacillus sp. FJAT-29790]|uniref:YwmB family TATA-box binding protein n=1 Tax=Bacillus sp. FJAT-29790 TaxID=1895002 RepID=UPI001C250F24|nr:YwmB family TATA-box binding protein [Bacillus sp. FJAT-29790]MBU8881076.1 YwmB family TATA-box binding protein [Bacillus sp. FJAT-29790]
MKKIKLILTIVGIIVFIMINIGNKSTVAKGELDLFTLASILQDEHILISEWSLHAREKMEGLQNEVEVEKFTEELKSRYADWEWSIKASEKHLEAMAVSKDHTEKETIKILSTPTNGKIQTYLIYEVNGQAWDPQSEQDISSHLENRISDIFRGNATIFSCIKGEFNDKMDKTVPIEMKQLLTAFQAKKIESLEEDNFISTSAHSAMFTSSVKTGGKDMNLQIGIRNQGLGTKTTLVVGTPIITVEY